MGENYYKAKIILSEGCQKGSFYFKVFISSTPPYFSK